VLELLDLLSGPWGWVIISIALFFVAAIADFLEWLRKR